MTPVSHGADTARLREIAGDLGQLANRIDGVEAAGTSAASVLDQGWVGDDHGDFGRSWQLARAQLLAASDRLTGYARLARAQADEQDAAAGAGGGLGTAIGAGVGLGTWAGGVKDAGTGGFVNRAADVGGDVAAAATFMRLAASAAPLGDDDAPEERSSRSSASERSSRGGPLEDRQARGGTFEGGDFDADPVDTVGTYEVPDGAVFFDSGGTGNWNSDLNNPAPDTTYVVDDRFVFTTDEHGRVVETHGVLELGEADRNSYQQTKAGGEDRQPGDQGGHIFGNAFGGPGEALNLLAMSAEANGAREYGQLEAIWRDELAKNPPPDIEMQMTPIYSGDSQRPTELIIDWTLDGEIQPQRIIDNG